MPRFLCYCPDYPDSLEKRFSVRPQHLVAAKADLDSGVQSAQPPLCVHGVPFLPRIGTKQRDAVLPEGTPNIAGSFMIYRFDSIEECWARLKADVYWTAGVWDKERMEVEELIG
ncbi:hypothetical protein EHS25_005102 [Saitozyma podzolica]|uniref:YCII-related domain-containing protein n=1 Tax=Saitozyma podzolica TaxID=1890683 RepID=A0A427Y2V2_9TREE|nr:hypothetical protein EHS25_005102 [Saitozyma podzolica]